MYKVTYPNIRFAVVLFSSLLFLAGDVNAEKADQDKPIILEAEKVSVNDVQQIYDLNGKVLSLIHI